MGDGGLFSSSRLTFKEFLGWPSNAQPHASLFIQTVGSHAMGYKARANDLRWRVVDIAFGALSPFVYVGRSAAFLVLRTPLYRCPALSTIRLVCDTAAIPKAQSKTARHFGLGVNWS